MFLVTLISTFDFVNGDFFDALYNEHKDRIYAIARSISGNNEDAEDIVQETLIKVYKNLETFRKHNGENVIPLIVIYTKNIAFDFLRKKKRQVVTMDITYDDGDRIDYDVPSTDATPEEMLIEKEMRLFLGACVDDLPELQRHLILLKYRYEMKNKDIAKIMSMSETAVSTRLSRIKGVLRKKMEERDK